MDRTPALDVAAGQQVQLLFAHTIGWGEDSGIILGVDDVSPH